MFFHQFGLLFTNMEWFVIVALVLGFAFLTIELFQPGFGIFGILGFVLLGASIILRAVFHKEGDNVLVQVFQLMLFEAIIGGGAFGLFVIATKKNWIKHGPFVQNETAVDKFSDGTADYTAIVGKTGVASTDLHPSGKAVFDEEIYDVVAENFFIDKGTEIVVKSVEGVKITVTNK